MLGDSRTPRYRRAGWTYLVLGIAIFGLTTFAPGLSGPDRRAEIAHLLIGLPFFVLFGLYIAFGDVWLAGLLSRLGMTSRGAYWWGEQMQEKITMILTISAALRTFIFAANGFGQRPRLVDLSFEPREPEPLMFISAALMATITFVLARASWGGFLRRLRS